MAVECDETTNVVVIGDLYPIFILEEGVVKVVEIGTGDPAHTPSVDITLLLTLGTLHTALVNAELGIL